MTAERTAALRTACKQRRHGMMRRHCWDRQRGCCVLRMPPVAAHLVMGVSTALSAANR